MLILIEHDSILSTPEARQSLAAFVAHRPNINVAVFHSDKLSAAEVCEAYPPELRARLMLTPDTPRDRDLRFWISYEVGCVFAALRHNGTLAQCEAVVCLVPPAWGDSARAQFGAKRVVVMDEPFSANAGRRLARSSTYRQIPVEPSPRSLPSKASVASMAAASAGVKTSSRGKSSGHSTRSASLSQRTASSASILG
ncbi:MAG: hypothetical protein PHW25_05825 [Zoogloea sp.]|uniref:hypothetical protein n=1 Tax=Zoogloea sp. TaxID=49181 RepID=UPI0026164F5B|nr:hypothetical protein [Zoogloea sp.]MDD3326590.1 hypothetical protein [Zoogloea sp.]